VQPRCGAVAANRMYVELPLQYHTQTHAVAEYLSSACMSE
jgi:hypothetical protein